MKKTYFAPETEIVNVQMESLMAVMSGGDDNVNVSVAEQEYTESVDVLSRGSSLWDDEE